MELNDYDAGDLVLFNGLALFYQTNISVGELEDKNVGLVLKKIVFNEMPTPEDDCQQVVDSELVIQEPKFVYTLLCKGTIVEVLDIDVNQLV